MGIERTGGPTLPPGLPSEQAREVRRAVVCERDELTRRSITGILAEDGFEVVGDTAEPADAVGLIRDRRPDVVVAGIAPGPADLLALAEITALRIAPVVVLATDSTPEQIAGARDAGALAYLTKPPSRAAVIPAVEVAIARYAEMRRLAADVEAASRRLESRKLIDRAKGLLMTHRRMTEPEAFRWIQRTAMDRRKASAVIAAQVVADLGEAPQHRAAS
ncbi:MAG TPA: ANTAR domain-containing protein [Nakamurella multipartita]|nr:ANTAR domain-containing protein [Nakamurella multipartita]